MLCYVWSAVIKQVDVKMPMKVSLIRGRRSEFTPFCNCLLQKRSAFKQIEKCRCCNGNNINWN